MNKDKKILNIIDKYKSKDLCLRSLTDQILRDKEYLKEHQIRTCKNSFDINPQFPIQTYGDGGAKLLFSKTLTLWDGWDQKYSDYNMTLKDIIEDILTMTYIFSSIFCHEKDKTAKNREDNSFINIEPIGDFKEFNKYFSSWHSVDLSSNFSLWVCYSHSKRFCNKIENFLNQLELN